MRANPEDRFQHEIIMWYGQTWPEYHYMLFEVNNNPENENHGVHRKAMGMKKNVSDLVMCIPNMGIFAGIECKAPETTWQRTKILAQFNWGKQIIENGGFYIMSSNKVQIQKFITYLINNDIRRAIAVQAEAFQFVENQLKNKTIKF